jgi:hypothetical protein
MATLTLTKTFVTLVSAGVSVSAQTALGRIDEYEVPGESRLYAGGRRRAITSAGQVATYTATLLLVSTADLATLRTWAGQAVQIRDNLGRRFFGVYRKVPATEQRGRPGRWHVTLALDALTITEGV